MDFSSARFDFFKESRIIHRATKIAVSYTHLDVYKRQDTPLSMCAHCGKHLHNFYFPMSVLTVDNSGLQGTLMASWCSDSSGSGILTAAVATPARNKCAGTESGCLRMLSECLCVSSMRLGVSFIAPRQLGAVEDNLGRLILPCVVWSTGQACAPSDNYYSLSGADLLPFLAQTTVAALGPLAHRTLYYGNPKESHPIG